MNARDIVNKMQNLKCTKVEAERILKFGFELIIDAVKIGERVTMLPQGIFKLKTRKERVGHNPKTGASVHIPEKKVVIFKESKPKPKKVESLKKKR